MQPHAPTTFNQVLIVGGGGFLGRRLIVGLSDIAKGIRVLQRSSSAQAALPGARVTRVLGDLADFESLAAACAGVDTVFHLAGHAHAWAENDDDGLHRKVTVEGTRNLLRAAAHAAVKRFVFASSVKAGGEGGELELDESSGDRPTTPYGRAKWQAEQLVLEAGQGSGMHVCNLRLAMVYGVGMKGNLPRMIESIDRKRFPPLPDSRNKRSMVWVDDVVQAMRLAASLPTACGKTYIVTDGETYSTRRIYTAILRALGKRPPTWSIPLSMLAAAAKVGDVVGRVRGRRLIFDSEALQKLLGSAWYSVEKIRCELGYRPTKMFEDVLPEIVAAYRAHDTSAR